MYVCALACVGGGRGGGDGGGVGRGMGSSQVVSYCLDGYILNNHFARACD